MNQKKRLKEKGNQYKLLVLGGVILTGLFINKPSNLYAANGYAGGSGTEADPY